MIEELSGYQSVYAGQRTQIELAFNPLGNKFVVKQRNAGGYNSGLTNEFKVHSKIIADYSFYESKDGVERFIRPYYEGISLKDFLLRNELTVSSFLQIAINLCQELQQFHQQGVIHLGLNPFNIIVNPITLSVHIVDLEHVVKISDIRDNFLPEYGNSAYLAPELRHENYSDVTYSSDYFSLGIIFFEILTRKLPFIAPSGSKSSTTEDSIIFDKIERQRKDLPLVIKDIIIKLVKQLPEDRYRSLESLEYDLLTVQNQIAKLGRSEKFKLDQISNVRVTSMPHQIIGRDTELSEINDFYGRLNDRAKLLLTVEGAQGVGKTFLIKSALNTIPKNDAIILESAFYKAGVLKPYTAWEQVLNKILDYLLSQDHRVFQQWEKALTEQLGELGYELLHFAPRFSIIFKNLRRENQDQLESKERLNRLNYAFVELFRVISEQADRPFLIVFDDYQWSDSASHNLLVHILKDSTIKNLMFVCAYRESYEWSSEWYSSGVFYGLFTKHIRITNLSQAKYNELIEVVFKGRLIDYESFCDLSFAITKGNPFFLSHYLKYLVEKELLLLQRNDLKWAWEKTELNTIQFGSIEGLIEARLLAEDTRVNDFLKKLAVFGETVSRTKFLNTFPEFNDVFDELIESLFDQEYLNISKLGNNNLLYGLKTDLLSSYFESRVDKKECAQLNEAVVRSGHRSIEAQSTYNIFNDCRHYNMCIDLENADNNKIEFYYKKNLEAAKLAVDGAAFQIAQDYIQICAEFYDKISDEKLRFDFHFTEFRIRALINDNTNFTTSFENLLRISDNPILRLKVYNITVDYYRQNNSNDKAIEIGIIGLAEFGIRIKAKYSFYELIPRLIYLFFNIKNKKNSFFRELPYVKEGQHFELTKLLSQLSTCAFFAAPSLLPVLLVINSKLLVTGGITSYNFKVFSALSILYSGNFKDYENGLRFRDLAKEFTELYNPRNAAEVLVVATYASHWDHHISHTLGDYSDAYQMAMRNGNLEFGHYALFEYYHSSFFLGHDLIRVEKGFSELKGRFAYLNDSTVNAQQTIYFDVVTILRHKKNFWQSFKNESYEKSTDIVDAATAYLYAYLKLYLAFIFKDRESYASLISSIEKDGVMQGSYVVNFALFVQSLAIFDGLVSGDLPKKYLSLLRRNEKRYRGYVSQCPENYLNKHQAIVACLEFVSGNKNKAREQLDKAIESSRRFEFSVEEAILWQIGGEMMYSRGNDSLASVYLSKAINLFKKWGANSVVAELEDTYPEVLKDLLTAEEESQPKVFEKTSVVSGFKNDIITRQFKNVLTVSESILSEINLSQLLVKFLQACIDWTEAKRGVVLLHEKDNLFIRSIIDLKTDFVSGTEDILLRDSGLVSESIVLQCSKSLESVILYDANSDTRYSDDPYVLKYQSRSILAVPIASDGDLLGVLYLEDGASIGTFNRDKLEVAKLFARQVSLTLSNVLRYSEQQSKLRARTSELENINKVVVENNRLINSSIRYALHIQNSILPTHATFSSYFDDFFIYYQPRDIVSGDFYWVHKIEGKIILAALDCTGHGVPGAFMSMIGNSILNNIVVENKITNPASILNELHTRVQKTLNQKETLNMDGMDGAIIAIDEEKSMIEFSGANNPLFYVVDEKHFTVKGTRQSIGGIDDREFPGFESTTIRAQAGMQLYLFSDGFQDQIGGPKNKKFMKKNFLNLLYNISSYPLVQQESVLKNTFKNWSGDNSAMDDVLVIGVQV